MKKYNYNEDGWFCGYWNQSPLQIKYSQGRPLKVENLHSHDFAEYYLVLEGKLTVNVNNEVVEVDQLELIMIEPGEKHKIIKKVPSECFYLIIKEKSYKQNKNFLEEE